MFLRSNLFLIFLFLFSCQPVEFVKPVEIDNANFEKFTINAEEIIIKNNYKSVFSEENIEDQLKRSPSEIVESWINDNISKIGNENKFVINIIDASIYRSEIVNLDAKKYEEKTLFAYEIYFLTEYILYDSDDFLIANATVESTRSTTSQKYISLNETDIILNDLLTNALKDFIEETKSQLSIYMSEYLIN